jgi:hypothetical protein
MTKSGIKLSLKGPCPSNSRRQGQQTTETERKENHTLEETKKTNQDTSYRTLEVELGALAPHIEFNKGRSQRQSPSQL